MTKEELELCVRLGLVQPIVRAYSGVSSIRHTRWLFAGLERALDRADPGSVSAETLARLREMGVSEARLEGVLEAPPAQAVHIPLVPEAPHPSFCRLMRVTYDPPGSLGSLGVLDQDARMAVTDALRAASERVGWRPQYVWSFGPVLVRGLEKMRIHGSSLGAGAFVSAYAAWTRRTVRAGTAVTGCVFEGRLLPVGEMEAKVRALVGRADITRFVVPTADRNHAAALAAELGLRCEVVGAATLDELLEICLSARPRVRRDIDAEVADAKDEWNRAWQDWRWPIVRERLAQLACDVPPRRVDLRVRVLTMLGASYRHVGSTEDALDVLGQALAIVATEEGDRAVSDYERGFLHRHLALVYRELCLFEEAEEAAVDAIRFTRAARNRGATVTALGSAGLVALARGHVETALAYFQEGLAEALEFDPGRAPRSGAYVVLAHGRAGRVDAARAQYAETLALLAELGESDDTRTTEQWLRTYMAEALLLTGHAHEACEVLAHPLVQDAMARIPFPGLVARRWLGLGEVARGELERGFSRLASGPSVHPHAREERVHFFAHLGVLYEAEARALRELLDDDARGRALLALEHLPQRPAEGAFLGSRIDRTRALLRDRASEPSGLREALRALLEACRALE